MKNLHDDIMNLPCDIPEGYRFENYEDERYAYKLGHRDARHAAAELAIEADKRIEELEEALKMIKFCCAVPARQAMRKIATDALGE